MRIFVPFCNYEIKSEFWANLWVTYGILAMIINLVLSLWILVR